MVDGAVLRLARRVFFGLAQRALELTRSVALWFARSVRGLAALGTAWLDYQVNKPYVKSIEDLRTLCHQSTLHKDGRVEFSFSAFTFVSKEYTVYYGRLSNRKLTPETINKSLERVPDEDVYPTAPSHITGVEKVDSSSFFKGPMLTFYVELGGSGQIAKALLQEAETLEILRRRPHPNVVRYHGCQVHRGRIVGLLLERHPCTLEERLYNGSHDLNLKLGFNGVKLGVRHLHSLGLAHNDIKPSNIMVSADNTWILIDMGSCRSIRDTLIIAGHPEWQISSKEHDEAALSEL
ncbi:kinase-like protein [Trematosphaeria pertusa]|uniref:Kinase-like protein n=1 Tax=Trematosphaeria pertusa TaxID=390896 RepID=A0A6A6I4C2_9PLEO|nr:kinase-like protein [Trematosphaeria pertusa]KAF2245147.1 kinase-like protein [Trematosphaeria pertusa]